jgi:hypothetical protein
VSRGIEPVASSTEEIRLSLLIGQSARRLDRGSVAGLSPARRKAGLGGRRQLYRPGDLRSVAAASDLFFEGGLANIAPYSVEVFGVRLGARSVGAGTGRERGRQIVGPVVLAVIAGTSNIVSPQATSDSIFPAFVFFAFCSFIVGLCFTLIPIETHGKPLQMDIPRTPQNGGLRPELGVANIDTGVAVTAGRYRCPLAPFR